MRESERLRDEFRATNEVPAVLIGSRLRGLVDDAIAALERAEARVAALEDERKRFILLAAQIAGQGIVEPDEQDDWTLIPGELWGELAEIADEVHSDEWIRTQEATK